MGGIVKHCDDCKRKMFSGSKADTCGFCRQEARRAADRVRPRTKFSVRPQNQLRPMDWDTARIEKRLAELDAEARQRRWRMQ